jgi:hypothetical protein
MKRTIFLAATCILMILSANKIKAQQSYDFSVANSDGKTIYYNILPSPPLTAEVTMSDDDNPYSGNIVIPDSVTYNGSTYLVTTIGVMAFAFSNELISITIPNSIIAIKEMALSYCFSLLRIDVNTDNPNYSSIDGVLFNKLQDTLWQCPNGKAGTYTVPSSVTCIGEAAFTANFLGLTSIHIPSSVTSIGRNAFTNSLVLQSIIVDDNNPNYSSIDGVLFNKLQDTLIQYPGGKTGDYAIPNSVTFIGEYAFAACMELTSVVIPSSVITIRHYAFMNSLGLEEIYVEAENPPVLGMGVFENVSDIIPIFVPCHKEAVYKNAQGWNYFINIIDECAAVEELTLENQLSIYPNPAVDNIHITLPENTQVLFTLYDMQGRILIKEEVSNRSRVGVNNLASGMYIYKVTTEKETQTGKLIIKD